MRTLRDFDDATWDRFFDFLYDDADELSDEEVERRLADAGIDMQPAYGRLRQMIATRLTAETEAAARAQVLRDQQTVTLQQERAAIQERLGGNN